jgi:uncharacterized protein (TIGR02117 family)
VLIPQNYSDLGSTRLALWIVMLLLGGACASVPPVADPAPPSTPDHTIYLVHNGWHSGIVVQAADLPPAVLPERADFPNARYLELGWGDRDFYQAHRMGVWMSLKAAFLPTASVLHIVGFNDSVTRFFPGSTLFEFRLSPSALERLSHYLHESLDRDGATRVPALGPGLYSISRFYPARGHFHMFNTCHAWTARAMQTAGYPFSPTPSASTLFTEAKRWGRLLQASAANR